MFIPTISASKVAGLIGLNPYQDAHETMYDVMCKNKLIRARIADIETQAHRKPLSQVRDELLDDPSVRGIVNAGIRACQRTQDVKGVLAEVEQSAKTTVQLRYGDYPEEVRAMLVDEVRGKVAKQRGLNNENHILDQYEEKHDVKVVERNTKNMRMEFGKFVLIGRTDGWVASENRIVDSKERTRFWKEPPVYDEIQLRCYMAMTGAPEAELIERFPNGSSRVTKYLNDADKWKTIRESIERVVDKMNHALADNEELKRIIFMNTVETHHGDCSGASTAAAAPALARFDL